MKYSVIQCSNGNYKIVTEHGTRESAFVSFHNTCKALWNASDVATAMVGVFDENLDIVEGHKEYIFHEQETTE